MTGTCYTQGRSDGETGDHRASPGRASTLLTGAGEKSIVAQTNAPVSMGEFTTSDRSGDGEVVMRSWGLSAVEQDEVWQR